MPPPTAFISATSVLASLDIQRSVDFLASHLGFSVLHAEQGVYGIVGQGGVQVHFWACADRKIAEATSCRLRVAGISELYARCSEQGIVHPRAGLADTPWGTREFAILDPDGNLVTFHEPTPH